jgi:methionine synthase / methylenetetrahydrofolate reductase (NADH)
VPDITHALAELSKEYRLPMGGYAHVGRFDPPDWMFTDEYSPNDYVTAAQQWAKLGAQVLGGCCGTTPKHIGALKKGLPKTLPS